MTAVFIADMSQCDIIKDSVVFLKLWKVFERSFVFEQRIIHLIILGESYAFIIVVTHDIEGGRRILTKCNSMIVVPKLLKLCKHLELHIWNIRVEVDELLHLF